jgi:hypothetical protein
LIEDVDIKREAGHVYEGVSDVGDGHDSARDEAVSDALEARAEMGRNETYGSLRRWPEA